MSVREDDHREEAEDAMRSILIHGGIDGDERTGAVSVPIYQTSTYRQDGIGGMRTGYEYSRSGQPHAGGAGKLIAELEEGRPDSLSPPVWPALTAVLFSSSLGTRFFCRTTLMEALQAPRQSLQGLGLSFDLVDASKLDSLARKISPDVRALILESPTNPLLEVTDIAAAAAIAKSKGVLTIVDNTFMTRLSAKTARSRRRYRRHSARNTFGGHSDLIADSPLRLTKDSPKGSSSYRDASGGILQPFDSWLSSRLSKKTRSPLRDTPMSPNASSLASDCPGTGGVAASTILACPGFKGREINLVRPIRGAIIAL